MSKYRKGNVIRGTVIGIENYGIFVDCGGYYTGLIHISEIRKGFVSDVNDYVKIGDEISVKILGVDEANGQLRLSIKNINYKKVNYIKRAKVKETKLGFSTLKYYLPVWIEKKYKKIEKEKKYF